MGLETLWRLANVLVCLVSSHLSANPVTGTTVLVGVALLAVLATVLLARPAAFGDVSGAGLALRSRSERSGVPRHRDPDAPGRTRPRGPTALPAVV